MQARSSSLWKVSCFGTGSNTKRDSHYRRIECFFSSFRFDYDLIGRIIFSFLPKNTRFDLAIDRTNWKFGSLDINVLYVGAIYKGVIYPLVWLDLPKKTKCGNSSTKHRKALILRALKLIAKEQVGILVGDKEFIDKEWVEFLQNKELKFVMRVRDNEIIRLDYKSSTDMKIKKYLVKFCQTRVE